jgi:diguanylate cyclase (GGDEF)-like protein
MGLGLVMLATFSVLSSRQIDRTIQSDGVTAGKQLALYLTERVADVSRHVHFAAEGAPRVRNLVFSEDAPTIQGEISRLTKEFSVDAVEVVNADGTPLGSSPELAELSKSGKAVIANTLRSNAQCSAVIRSGSKIYMISCAPMSSGGYLKGAIAFFETLGHDDALRLSRESGYGLGFTVGGRLVISSTKTRFQPPKVVDGPKALSVGGRSYVSISQPLPSAAKSEQLGFVILRPTDAITAPYEEARSAFVSVLLVSLVISLVVGVSFGRGIVQPIVSLASAARVIQHGDWPEPFVVERQDEIGSLQGSFNDMIEASKGAQERLLAMIDLDPLTELSNHRYFLERLGQEARRSEASGYSLALAIIDLDGFDAFNETHGHAAGDEALQLVSDTIRACMPEFGIAARFAGDQFTVLVPESDGEKMAELARAVSKSLKAKGCGVGISIGCSEFPKSSSKENGFVLAAELALARAKQLGKDQVCLFDAVPGANESADPFQLYQYLENGSFATIQALAAAVDAKDTYTNGHSERVARYSSMLSSAVGDTPDMVDRIFRCGTLHDVGKIGVPDAILKKPGRLDDDEQRVMETHPVLGEMIAEKVPQLADLLPGVRHHHERWDGRGYPDQLAGEKIPYIARILAVADTYDAMTSDRPYRKGLDQAIALAEIEKNAGTQFDPDLAFAFVALMRAQANVAAA